MTEQEKREIKFRAWDEKNKIMHNNFQFIRSGTSGSDWIIFISDKFSLTEHKTNPFKNPNPYFAQQLKIMQFIGLLDKQGKEIYEGDILQRGTTISDVVWEDCGFKLRKGNSVCDVNKPIEIIGNIYENPELLEVK